MTGSRFRLAEADDVPALVGLVERAYRGDASRDGWCTEADLIDGQRVDTAMVRASIDEPDGVVLVLEDEVSILACCELRRLDGSTATLGMFAVDPLRQAGGVGRSVLAEAERRVVAQWGVDRMEMSVIDVRSSLIDWYQRRGYSRTGEHRPFPYGDDRFGVPRVEGLRFAVLEKRLDAATGMMDRHV